MPCAVIVTALPVEYLAVRAHLSDLQEVIHPQGTVYERGQFVADGAQWDVGIVEIGTGNVGAALEAERAIAYFNPDVLLFVGIAGGIKDVAIGDVVVSTKIYGYESGRAEQTFKPRPEIRLSSYSLEQRARAEARKGNWQQRLTTVPKPTPRVFVAPIAAGERVTASTKSEVFQFLRENYGDAIAVEMEGSGFLTAAHANRQISGLVIRGISDLIGNKTETAREGYQELAARHASTFAFELLAKLILEEESSSKQVEGKPPDNLRSILFLAANPKDIGRLQLDQELRDIAEGLQRAQKRDQFNLEQRLAVRPRDIQRAMLDVGPQIIHFSGHGEGAQGLVFEDEVGNAKLVDGIALAGIFELFADQITCVVLNGCYSEEQAKAISQHIPYVIGMNQDIGDKAAIAFAVGFYDALGSGRPIEFAYKLGCAAIRLEGIAENLTPVLLKQSTTEDATVQPKPDESTPTTLPTPLAPAASEPIEVFISYSHKDEDLKDELYLHLANLTRQNKIKPWQDRAIEAGTEWDTEIKARLESAGIILLLITPRFIASDYYFDREMQRAMERHAAGTARVIPIIMKPCDWQDIPFSRLQVLPKDAKPVTSWNDRDEALLNVVQGIRKAVESLQANRNKPRKPSITERGLELNQNIGLEGIGSLWNVPRLPLNFVSREEELKALKDKLLSMEESGIVIGSGSGVSIQGPNGIGKSILAAAVAQDLEVRQKFPDGVFWLSVGEEAKLPELQMTLAKALEEQVNFNTVSQGKTYLKNCLAGKSCLLILDDVWNTTDLAALNVVDQQGKLLVTTRNASIGNSIGLAEHHLEMSSELQARQLLARLTQLEETALPTEANEIARECGYLPLALSIVGAMLRDKPDQWGNVLHQLQSANLDKIRQLFPDVSNPNILKAIQVSADALESDLRSRYLELSVFPEDVPISEQELKIFWSLAGLNESEAQDVINSLSNKSLIQRDEVGRIILHDLQRDYLRRLVENLPELQVRLSQTYTLLHSQEELISTSLRSVSIYSFLFEVSKENIQVGDDFEIVLHLQVGMTFNENAHCLEISKNITTEHELNIMIHGSGIQFNGENVANFPLDNLIDISEDICSTRFYLTALRPGICTIKVEVFYGVLHFSFVEELLVSQLNEPNLQLPISARSRPIPQPDLILKVQTVWNENLSNCTFRYHLDSFHPRLPFAREIQQQSETLSVGWLEQTRSLLQTTLEEATNSLPEDFRARLTSLGQHLFQQLLSPELQTTFRSVMRFNQPFTLMILADQDAGLPWELLHDGQSFWGERFIIGRWFWELDRTRPYEFVIGAVNVAHYADVEYPDQWASLLKPSGAPPPMMLSGGVLADLGVLDAMRGLHLLRRGKSLDEVDRQNAPVPFDRNGAAGLDQELQPAKLSLRRNRPLVTLGYVNAGLTELTMLEQTWAPTFIRSGCSAFIGALWAVQPAVEAAFVSSFYHRLWTGDSLGVAFQAGRRAARSLVPDSLDWMAYILFGDPMARPYRPTEGKGYAVVEPIGQEITDAIAPGASVRFRVSLRRTPPVWYTNRLMDVAEDLAFNDLQVYIAASGLQVTPAESIGMQRTPTGDYLGWFTLTVPSTFAGDSALVQVHFEDGIEPIHSLRFSLAVGNPEGEPQ